MNNQRQIKSASLNNRLSSQLYEQQNIFILALSIAVSSLSILTKWIVVLFEIIKE
jgi:hypothetical protein